MPSLREIQLRREERAKKAEENAKTASMKARAEALKARRAVEAIHLKVRNMAGDAILAAEESGDITPQEHAVLGGLFARWKHKPAEFDLLAEKFPAPSPARPAVVPDPLSDAAE